MGAAAVTGLALSGRNEQYGVPLRMESIEERLRKLEARVKILDIKDAEEIRAVEIIKMDAKQHGLKLEGGTIRRTSSRFCLGVEHGDYNGTELFGVGTDRFIWMAYKPNNSGKIRIYSHNFPGEGVVEFTPGKIPPPQSSEIADVWARFVYGVDHVMRKHGYSTSQGFDATIVGNIPGGGMSRSASLILNVLLTMMELNGCSLPHGDFKVVTMACEVENEYVGTPCGNLDQIMIYYAKQGMGTRFNPKTKEVTYIPLGLDAEMFRIAALDTGTVRHGLEKSTYAVRVKECQELVQLLKKNGYKVACLGDVKDRATYDKIMSQFGESHPHLLRRLEYIYFAQERFEAMVKAWADGRIEEVGAIFRRDGIGLRDEYQISGPELEAMVDVARTVPGVIGERMLGGGDKGASGAILHPEAESGLRTAVDTGFKRSYPNLAEKCAVHVVRVCKGIEVMEGLL
eukprot:TRINITY_DN63094_c0_g1_i1.p1 TRINITY_DN63094_c0_g1~~TRINITY_DN63094_c0_g1_i1.p1  ORF type:complete len:493 (-),score=108.43 TRINITY_DN63094_c0_g1_i1:81-1451(-)